MLSLMLSQLNWKSCSSQTMGAKALSNPVPGGSQENPMPVFRQPLFVTDQAGEAPRFYEAPHHHVADQSLA